MKLISQKRANAKPFHLPWKVRAEFIFQKKSSHHIKDTENLVSGLCFLDVIRIKVKANQYFHLTNGWDNVEMRERLLEVKSKLLITLLCNFSSAWSILTAFNSCLVFSLQPPSLQFFGSVSSVQFPYSAGSYFQQRAEKPQCTLNALPNGKQTKLATSW